MVLASYYVRVPSLKSSVGLTDGRLGVVLTFAAVAALLGMQFAAALSARYGSSLVARVSAVALPVSLSVVGLSGGFVPLLAALLLFGAVGGLLDVAMNSQAIAVERALDRPVMNGCHAAWSLGSIIGSLLGSLAVKGDVPLTWHYLLLGVPVVVFAAVIGRWLMPVADGRAPEMDAGERPAAGRRSGWSPAVVLFGVMGAAVLLLEGAVSTWSGVYLHEDRGATLAVASLAYVGFSALQAAGRLFGDRLHRRFGAVRLVFCGGLLAIAGLALALVPSPAVAIAGFAVLGAGLSVLLPVILSAVGHSSAQRYGPASVATAVSRFTTVSYAGILLGPVVVGWLAEGLGLTWTLAGLQVLLVGVVLLARRTAAADQREQAPGRTG
ncbi:MFS transporter [Planobispora siamensis]|uniref:MFS transporter n=2 Tax=Planobispora siamensis TaxID=936338 RepID=A0A8J3WNL9_9ACTN|nr:MFS transporter [Planobispora siamensis]